VSEGEHLEASGSQASVGVDAGEAQGKPSQARRTLHILGALLVAVVLPAVVIGVLVGEFGATAMVTGVLLGGVGAKLGGTRRMGYLAPLMGLAAGLGAFSAYDWWWVAVLATVGVIAGAGIGFGWFAPLLMVPYAATFVVPEASARNATVYGLIVGIATLYGVVLARRFGVPEVVDGERLSAPVAAVVALGFGAVLAASASLGVALGWTEPYWVPEPVLILVLYILMGKRDRIRGKAVGTALGVVAVIPVALVSPPAWVLTALGVVVFLVALTQAKTYWLMYGLYTFSVVLLLATPGHVGFEAEERGFQILVGIGLLVIGLAIVHALGAWAAKRDPQPELAT
jgi:fusaric acid resistance family protein